MSIIVPSPPATPERSTRHQIPTSKSPPSLADLMNQGMENYYLWIKCLPVDRDGIENIGAYTAEAIEDTPGANDLPDSDEALIRFLSEIYTSEIIIPVICQLAQTRSDDLFALPPAYIQRSPCKKIAHDILRLILERWVDEQERLGIFTDEVDDSAGGDGAAQAGGNISCGNTEATTQILVPPGSSLSTSNRLSSGDPPDEKKSSGSLACEQVTRLERPSVKIETVALPMWSSLSQTMASRRQHIPNTRSGVFAASPPCRPYTLTPWDGKPGHQNCYLFHGTRSRYLNDFLDQGIHIQTFQSNELASVPVFYACNFAQAAYEHPLIAHHRVTGDVNLHVSVLVFDFDSDVLLGLKPAPGEVTSFTSRTLTARTEDEMNQFNSFCNLNRNRGDKIACMNRSKQVQRFREKPSTHEIIIAPICIPVGGISRGIVPNIPGYHQQLLQIGFCSERSRKYANSCLFKALAEKRDTSGPGFIQV
ncbi:hypothetical protein PILCRDRAFT_819995 [Piloderma croceum F 1598]|uniref:Uncharacterized protein n=1 Tax=Piloderma croceum (strain F 1598) TaxID=765440 RepID=A0A0C3B8T7_PILCF|nr:hypothetical protein PILCRDRAFT_819995 [Piloderma croceum F 1598]